MDCKGRNLREEAEKEEVKSKASMLCRRFGWLSFDKRFQFAAVPDEEDFKELLKA
jgi:hypothetical protein